MTTRVLVTGATGQVGVDLMDVLAGDTAPGGDVTWQPDGRSVRPDEFEVVGVSHHELDVADPEAVRRVMAAVRPDVVVNLAAYTAVDRAESEPELCRAINATALTALSASCDDLAAHLITISTDYVFDGTKGSSYFEGDATNPLGVYGATKREGELLCRPRDTIVRTSWVMGSRGKNIAKLVQQRCRDNAPVRFVNDQVGSPTMAADLSRALVTLVREKPGGVVHLANSGVTSWFDLVRLIADTFEKPSDFVTAISTEELIPSPTARRPALSGLAMQRWSDLGFSDPPRWEDALVRLLRVN
ncbi:MAG: dTDP-4-dehydrorhamnose reductase [Actinomycetota bacterium]|jgi:dTDP-4-dehydrorhamnose reductase